MIMNCLTVFPASASLAALLASGLAAQHPRAALASPVAMQDDQVQRDAPAPLPVTAQEQSALARPLAVDTPPAPDRAAEAKRRLARLGIQDSVFELRQALTLSGLIPWDGNPLAPGNPGSGLGGSGGMGPNGSGSGSGSIPQPSAIGTIAFADYIGLLILPDQAGHTFASSPFYIQGVGSGWVHVKENDVARYGSAWGSGYNHYHLMYEAGPFCIPSGGTYGYQLNFFGGSLCIPVVTPASYPRYLASHHGTQWIRVYVYKSGVSEMTFDFRKIRVRGTQGIKLYFREANGNWLHWNNLGPGVWNTAPYAGGIREILIRSSNNSPNFYSLDDIEVRVN